MSLVSARNDDQTAVGTANTFITILKQLPFCIGDPLHNISNVFFPKYSKCWPIDDLHGSPSTWYEISRTEWEIVQILMHRMTRRKRSCNEFIDSISSLKDSYQYQGACWWALCALQSDWKWVLQWDLWSYRPLPDIYSNRREPRRSRRKSVSDNQWDYSTWKSWSFVMAFSPALNSLLAMETSLMMVISGKFPLGASQISLRKMHKGNSKDENL